jgi:hypothetical protein
MRNGGRFSDPAFWEAAGVLKKVAVLPTTVDDTVHAYLSLEYCVENQVFLFNEYAVATISQVFVPWDNADFRKFG